MSASCKYGFKKLDELTSGMAPGEIVIIGSRPAAGKTTFALNIAANNSRQLLRENSENTLCPAVCYFLPHFIYTENLMKQVLASEKLIHRKKLKFLDAEGRISKKGMDILFHALDSIKDYPLFIRGAAKNIEWIISEAKKMRQKHKVAMIIVDYIQLASSGNTETKDRPEEIADIAIELKTLARDLKIPIIILSQLSRKLTERQNKKPMLSDLRDGARLGQIADTVLLLNDDNFAGNNTEIIIAKSRNGVTGSVNMIFEKTLCKFHEC